MHGDLEMHMFGKPLIYEGTKTWGSLKPTRTDSSIEKGNESEVASDTNNGSTSTYHRFGKPPAIFRDSEIEQQYERFESMLTQTYEDENSWWDAVETCMEKDDDFKTRVRRIKNGGKSRKQAIVEVMLNLFLEMENITIHDGWAHLAMLTSPSIYPMELMTEELMKRGANPWANENDPDGILLQYAVLNDNVSVAKILLRKGANVVVKDSAGNTPLLNAASYSGNSPEIAMLLIEYGADVHVIDTDNKTCLHLAMENDNAELVLSLLGCGVSVRAEDKNGWTPLHEAAYFGSEKSAKVLVDNGANVNAIDHNGKTPLHIAVDHQGEDPERVSVINLLLKHKADVTLVDYEGCTPMDLATDVVIDTICTHPSTTKHDEGHKKHLEKFMKSGSDRIKDDIVAGKIREMSSSGVIELLKSEENGGSYNFVDAFVKKDRLTESTRAIMDHFVLGRRRVNCEIMEADAKGYAPDDRNFDPNTSVLLDVIVKNNDEKLAQHPAVQAMVNYKWKKFVKKLYVRSFVFYIVTMLVFAMALFIAARPDLDNPGCYRDGWDAIRCILEVLSLFIFLARGVIEILEMKSYKREYFRDYYNYLQLLAVILPFTIIPFRAVTTWCASTGIGYCALPVGNATDINQSCIVFSHLQWIFASLAYLFNAVLIIEYLSLFNLTGIYIRILLKILKSDMLKFGILYCVFLFIFVGSFYLGLRAGVTIKGEGELVTDANLFSLETLYPWHVLFTGVRILVESGSVVDYFNTDDNGVYVGYQWYSVLLYLLFLVAVIIVLLNLLIAQMSDSYSEIKLDAEGTFAMARARIVARLQKNDVMCKTIYKKKHYTKFVIIDRPESNFKERKQESNTWPRLQTVEEKVDALTRMTEELARSMKQVTEELQTLLDLDLN